MKIIAQIIGIIALSFAPLLTAAPYVGSAEALDGFGEITQEQMDYLRTRKILFASRSFGLNLRDGLSGLASGNSMYDILDGYQRFDVFNARGDLSIIPENIYDSRQFVHFLATYWPHSRRIDEVDQLLRNDPWNFADEVDIVMIFFHYARPDMFPYYSEKLDALRADFPHIQFIYACAGYMEGATHASENQASYEFNELLKAEYLGEVPIYDLAAILSKDGAVGKSYAPEYSIDPSGVHPNSALGEEVMGKGFLLLLRNLYFGDSQTLPSQPGNLQTETLSDRSIRLTWDASTVVGGRVQYYEIYRNGVAAGTSFETSFLDDGLDESTTYNYSVTAVSAAGAASAASVEVSAATLADTIPPSLVGAEDASVADRVTLHFSESLEPVSAVDVDHYLINGLTVFSAEVNGATVTLTTSPMSIDTEYTVSVSGVKDDSLAGNVIQLGASAVFRFVPSTLPGQVAFWSFNGNLNDAYGASTTWISEPSFGDGFYGQGLSFDGSTTNPYVRVADQGSHDGAPGLTVSLWARKNHAATGGPVLKKHIAYDLSIGSNTVNGYIFNAEGQSVYFSASTNSIADTDWHHYVVCYDGETIGVYVDGNLVSTANQTGNVASSSHPIYIGKLPWGSQVTFAGQIDEVSIYNQAVDAGKLYESTRDLAAVEALLEANGVARPVESMIVRNREGRIVELYLQEAGISEITADIGQLTELSKLHCYGDRTLGLPLLVRVDAAIVNCANIRELLLNQNDLEELPEAIINLQNLEVFSVGDNLLAEATEPVRAWLNQNDPDWLDSQANASPKPQTWQQYQQEYFEGIEDQEALTGIAADPDHDGLANLLEFYLQSRPDIPTERGHIQYSLTEAGVVFELRHLSAEAPLIVDWQTCSVLGEQWMSITPLNVEVLEAFDGVQTSRVTLAFETEQQAFYRLVVEMSD